MKESSNQRLTADEFLEAALRDIPDTKELQSKLIGARQIYKVYEHSGDQALALFQQILEMGYAGEEIGEMLNDLVKQVRKMNDAKAQSVVDAHREAFERVVGDFREKAAMLVQSNCFDEWWFDRDLRGAEWVDGDCTVAKLYHHEHERCLKWLCVLFYLYQQSVKITMKAVKEEYKKLGYRAKDAYYTDSLHNHIAKHTWIDDELDVITQYPDGTPARTKKEAKFLKLIYFIQHANDAELAKGYSREPIPALTTRAAIEKFFS